MTGALPTVYIETWWQDAPTRFALGPRDAAAWRRRGGMTGFTFETTPRVRCDDGADGVIGFGGGSSMDTAKLAALLAGSGELLDAVYGVGLARGPRLALVQVPTTAGTGSEVTPIAIVTTPEHEKKGVVSGLLYPDPAVLDATLTTGLPPRVTAMTGIDAVVHAIEAYTTRHRKNVVSDALAVRALGLLSGNLRRVLPGCGWRTSGGRACGTRSGCSGTTRRRRRPRGTSCTSTSAARTAARRADGLTVAA